MIAPEHMIPVTTHCACGSRPCGVVRRHAGLFAGRIEFKVGIRIRIVWSIDIESPESVIDAQVCRSAQ